MNSQGLISHHVSITDHPGNAAKGRESIQLVDITQIPSSHAGQAFPKEERSEEEDLITSN